MREIRLSVIMAVYNGALYLREAIDSILAQTYQNWELIIIDDGSTDQTPDLLAQCQDLRIRVYRNEQNQKLPASLNRALGYATGTYILRMDADDICRPDRFERQLAFMETHPEADLSWAKGFRFQNGVLLQEIQSNALLPADVKALFLFTSQVMHNCVIARRSFYETFSYDPAFCRSEDWNLWYRASGVFTFLGQNDYLILYRIHNGQTTMAKDEALKQEYEANFTLYAKNMGMELTASELTFHTRLVCGKDPVTRAELRHWFSRLQEENHRLALFEKHALTNALYWKLLELRRQKRLHGPLSLRMLCSLGPVRFFTYYINKIRRSVKDLRIQKAAKSLFHL